MLMVVQTVFDESHMLPTPNAKVRIFLFWKINEKPNNKMNPRYIFIIDPLVDLKTILMVWKNQNDN